MRYLAVSTPTFFWASTTCLHCHMEPNSEQCGSKMSIHDLLLLLFTPDLQYILMGLASYVSHFFGHQQLPPTVLWSPILLDRSVSIVCLLFSRCRICDAWTAWYIIYTCKFLSHFLLMRHKFSSRSSKQIARTFMLTRTPSALRFGNEKTKGPARVW
jgi:hypothetical protein